MSLSLSPLAKQVPGVRDPKLGKARVPWGFLLHTTGSGVTAQARREHRTPIAVALDIYINSQNGSNGYLWGGPSYVIDHNGMIYQLAPDEILTAHAGGANRDSYLDGTWITKCSVVSVAQWRLAWPSRRHPYSLFPSTSPNTDFIGCEMIPIGDGFGGAPMAPGLRFTQAQHDAAIVLARDVGARHSFGQGWAKSSRLVGHEDVDLINRHDTNGGWDPGFLRVAPYFNFPYVRASI